MSVDIGLEGLSSNEAYLTYFVASIRFSVKEPVVAILRKLVTVAIDGLQVVVIPAFMDFRSNSEDSECVFIT